MSILMIPVSQLIISLPSTQITSAQFIEASGVRKWPLSIRWSTPQECSSGIPTLCVTLSTLSTRKGNGTARDLPKCLILSIPHLHSTSLPRLCPWTDIIEED